MWSLLRAPLLTIALVLFVVATNWIVTRYFPSMVKPSVISTDETTLPTRQEPSGEVWLTIMRFHGIVLDIARYHEISDVAEWEALSDVRTLEELWNLLHKNVNIIFPLVRFAVPRDYLRDGWDRPYLFDIQAHDEQTVLRITSGGQGKELYVEFIFTRKKKVFRATGSWQKAPIAER
jgi:hypothetical protein